MRIGYLSTIYHTSHILKTKRVVIAEWRIFGTGMDIISSFQSGKIDLAYVGLTPAIMGIVNGLDIVCIAGGHVEGTVIAGKAENGEKFPKNLEGKTVGVPSKGSIHDVILRSFSARADFEIVNYPWAEMILDDFIEGKIDAVCGTPNLAVLAGKHGAKILGYPERLWPWNPSYGIVSRKKFIEENLEKITDFLIKHEWATNILRESRDFASTVLSEYLKNEIDSLTVREILDFSPKYCSSLPEEYVESTLSLAKTMVRLGYISRVPEPDELFNTEIISEIHPQREHYTRTP